MNSNSENLNPCFNQEDQPLPVTDMTPGAGYNYPANMNLKDGWDVYADVS